MKITNIENILYSHSEALSEILGLMRGDTTGNTTNININQRGTTLNNKYVTPDHPNNNHLINDTSIQRVSDEETMDRASSRSDLTQDSQHHYFENNKIINNDLRINLDGLNYKNNHHNNYNNKIKSDNKYQTIRPNDRINNLRISHGEINVNEKTENKIKKRDSRFASE